MRKWLIPSLMLLAACDPQQVADKALRRTAESVVMPVVSRDMPAGVAATATQCILNAADQGEINMLARDVGVEAGTQTIENIRIIAERPTAASCFAAGGVPPLRG